MPRHRAAQYHESAGNHALPQVRPLHLCLDTACTKAYDLLASIHRMPAPNERAGKDDGSGARAGPNDNSSLWVPITDDFLQSHTAAPGAFRTATQPGRVATATHFPDAHPEKREYETLKSIVSVLFTKDLLE